MADPKTVVEVAGREVAVSNPEKVYFPRTGHTKLDLVRYYLAVADGALRGVARAADGAQAVRERGGGGAVLPEARAASRPDWIETAELRFPSGRTADEVVLRDAAGLAWVANLGCIDLNPHPVLASDLDHPDELRVDLDPVPGVEWPQIVAVALVARSVLADFGLTGWAKTSGSRGMHIYARISPSWSFTDVRRAAVAVAREIERRAPDLATSKWWKEERHGVFVDYNQNAKDRTVASAYSVRPLPDARVSTPLTWDEVPGCDPSAFTIDTVPARFAPSATRGRGWTRRSGSLDGAARAGGPRRGGRPAGRPVAAALREAGRRGAAGPAVQAPRRPAPRHGARTAPSPTGPPPVHEAADRDRPRQDQGRGDGGPGALEGAPRRTSGRCLKPADVLVDSMRGRSSTWTRIRLNLEHVPEEQRPAQEPLEVDYDPWAGFLGDGPASPRHAGNTA